MSSGTAADVRRPLPLPAESVARPSAVLAPEESAIEAGERLAWPSEITEGDPAKQLLLEILLVVQQRLEAVDGYSATFRKQERIGGEIRPEQTMFMKVRHEPFSVYLKFLAPKAGKEVIYAEGRYDNHVIGHNGDWSRLLVPRLKVAPTDALALADNRHPITEAGLLNLVNKLIQFRRMDLEDAEAETVLDTIRDERDRLRLRSRHEHPHFDPDRPFARVEVLYDPETWIPCQITSYDWPPPGSDHAEPLFGERYVYDDIKLDASLVDLDFDPANPDYAFKRF